MAGRVQARTVHTECGRPAANASATLRHASSAASTAPAADQDSDTINIIIINLTGWVATAIRISRSLAGGWSVARFPGHYNATATV